MVKALVSGLGRLIDIWPRCSVGSYRHTSEVEALRSDTQRIGDDMRRVIERRSLPADTASDAASDADLRRKVMARHPVVRAYLAKN